ncbi:aLK and LTK ligand 2a [Austrofundulus limnaeus]|uniref:ALK and LTK ligand 2a n=1 Tax=Austrofundulus limnaeus TaxID=52670 RepID=A0A2I4BH23_AUSLI|nr:PREDICTED: protein FAM150B [Austrofundulus limnaeus]
MIVFLLPPTGAMNGQRRPVFTGLLVLMCALSEHRGQSAPTAAPARPAGGDALRSLARRMVEVVRHVDGGRGRHSARTEAPVVTSRAGSWSSSVELRDLRSRTERGGPVVVSSTRDPKKKEKILKYFTGPLVFSSKCRIKAYRLYHHTRDCTIPAYFKRCARLLTRLAGSPQCTEG